MDLERSVSSNAGRVGVGGEDLKLSASGIVELFNCFHALIKFNIAEEPMVFQVATAFDSDFVTDSIDI